MDGSYDVQDDQLHHIITIIITIIIIIIIIRCNHHHPDNMMAVLMENSSFKEFIKLFKVLKFPDYVSCDAQDLITKLLNVDDELRLGMGDNGTYSDCTYCDCTSSDCTYFKVRTHHH